MLRTFGARTALLVLAPCVAGLGAWSAVQAPRGSLPDGAGSAPADSLDHRFAARVRPFLERFCFSCHGPKRQRAELDLSRDATVAAVAKNAARWQQVLERLQAREMPPETAPRHPGAQERAAVVAWLRDLLDREARRNAGDPGTVLARRLSNAEFDNTIRDLTGIDIRPTREFP